MAAKGRRKAATVIAQLEESPESFDFFQAVRVLERAHWSAKPPGESRGTDSIGRDVAPGQEFVRFRTWPSLRFASSLIKRIRWRQRGRDDKAGSARPEVSVNFMGLTGSAGILPSHYTELVIRRGRDRDSRSASFSICSTIGLSPSSIAPGRSIAFPSLGSAVVLIPKHRTPSPRCSVP